MAEREERIKHIEQRGEFFGKRVQILLDYVKSENFDKDVAIARSSKLATLYDDQGWIDKFPA